LRLVFDTNVVVSALLLPDSVPRRAFDKALDRGTVLLSLPTLTELNEVFARRRFDKYLPEEKRMRFLATLVKASEVVRVTETIEDCRDPRDNKFLELAVSGRADCIITGDEDLLALNPYRGIQVLTPKEFLTDL
jgi:uncharacterized protein